MKVKSLVLKKFHNDEWLRYLEYLLDHILIKDSIKESSPVETLKYVYEEYKRMQSLDCQVDGIMVADADRAADQAWSCLNAQLKIELIHPNEKHRNAARNLYCHLIKYGNPTRLTYDLEYSKLKQLLDDLAKASEEDLRMTHAYDWMIELQKRYTHFMDIYRKRIDHSASVDLGTGRLARQSTETAYKSLIEYLNTTLQHARNDEIESTVSELNAYIETQNASFKQRAANPSKANDIPEMPETIEDMDMDEDDLLKIDA